MGYPASLEKNCQGLVNIYYYYIFCRVFREGITDIILLWCLRHLTDVGVYFSFDYHCKAVTVNITVTSSVSVTHLGVNITVISSFSTCPSHSAGFIGLSTELLTEAHSSAVGEVGHLSSESSPSMSASRFPPSSGLPAS